MRFERKVWLIFSFSPVGQLKVDEDESEDTAAEAKKPEEGGDAAPTQQPAHTGSTLNVHPLLSSVVNYTHPTHFAGNLRLHVVCMFISILWMNSGWGTLALQINIFILMCLEAASQEFSFEWYYFKGIKY
jgi:hypothetical protein